MTSRLLFERLPRLHEGVAHLPLATLPTPVERFSIGGRELLVKRDDLSARPYAGNKVRKLEFLLAEAQRAGARRVITAGAFGSHHALATTIYGRRNGLEVTCVLFPQAVTEHVLEILRLIAGHGAELRFTRRMEGVPFALRRARWRARGEGACVIPPGGSNAVGALGYVEAALELDAQIRAGECPEPWRIHVAAGTLGTVAGLAVGLALAGRRLPVRAVRITSPLVTNQRALRALVRGVLAILQRAGASLPTAAEVLAAVSLEHDQVGAGYGRETAAGEAAAAAFAAAGLRLDATYTAKAAADLLAEPPSDRPPLFWHTLSAVEPEPDRAPAGLPDLPEPFRTVLQG